MNPDTVFGFVNHYISEGILKDKKALYKGKSYLVPEGINHIDTKINLDIAEVDMGAHLGHAAFSVEEGMIKLAEDKPVDNAAAIYDELSPQEKSIIKDLATEYLTNAVTESATSAAPQKVSESDLKQKLISFLNKLGIKTMSIDRYLEKYKVKNGVDPTATALADLANRVIAFKDGMIGLDQLTEEVMHFIVEMLPSEDTANILRNIHRSDEYAEHADRYRDVYSKQYPDKSPQEIENLVRKEILGKVLKNSLLAPKANPAQRNFYQKALDFIRDFFNGILGINDTFKQELTDLNNKVEQLLIQEGLEGLETHNLSERPFVMYQLSGQSSGNNNLDLLRSINKYMLSTLKQAYLSIKKGGGSLYADKVKLTQYEDRIDQLSQAESAGDFLALINRMADYVGRAVNNADSKGKPLSLEEQQVLTNLKDGVTPLLQAQLRETQRRTPSELGLTGRDKKQGNKRKRMLVSQIEDTLKKLDVVMGDAALLESNVHEVIMARMKERHNLGDEYDQFIRTQSKQMQKEISWFMETFGQLTHSSDALLNVAGQIIEELYGKHASRTQRRYRKFTKIMEENGVTAEELTQLYDKGFLVNPHDYYAFERKLEEIDAKVHNEVMGTDLSTESYLKAKEEGTLEQFNNDQSLEANVKKSAMLDDFVERRMTSEYYQKQAEKYRKLGISQYTINQLKALSLQRAVIQNRATDDDGRVIYTDDNKGELDALSQMRKEYKSITNSIGKLRTGIIEMTAEEARDTGWDLDDPRVVEIGGLYYALKPDATNEAVMAVELHLIDKDYEENSRETNNRAFVDKFIQISTTDGFSAGLDFVRNNMGASFSEEFWNSLSMEDLLSDPAIASIEANKTTIKKIRMYRNRLYQIKRMYQDPKNPQEIKGYEMTSEQQERIKGLAQDIEIEKSNLIYPEGYERAPFDERVETERSVNLSYMQALEKEDIEELSKDEFDFIRKHVTDSKRDMLNKLENQAKSLDAGRAFVSQKSIEQLEEHREEGETYYEAFVKIARQQLLPYYRRFTPAGYQTIEEVLSGLTDQEVKQAAVVDYITHLQFDPMYELNIHYTFNNQDENVNPNYDKDFEGGFYQPRLDKFTNKKFEELFGGYVKDERTGKIIGVRKNQNLYNVQQALVDLQRENLKDVGMHRSHNIFLAPQISRTRNNQVADALKKENKIDTIKEALKDIVKYRIDDLEYGERENQTDIQLSTDFRTVPIFYIKKLENPNDVSDDLFYSYLAMTSESIRHKTRREGLADILAVEDRMINRGVPGGKAAQSTRNYKMLKSAIDYNFFGKQETRAYKVKLPFIETEIDLTKLIRGLHKYVKLRNLGLNVIVPFTSLITAEVQLQIESVLGEYISKDSLKLANSEFAKLFKEAAGAKNSLAYNDKSKLNLIGEFFGAYAQIEKASNAKYSTLYRWIPKMGMVLHRVGNFPVIPRVFLAILHDHRVVNGKLLSRKDFIKAKKAEGLTTKQAKSDWRQYESETLYNYLDVTEEGVKYKPELLQKLGGNQEYLDSKEQRIKSLIKDQIQKIDGQIPESQRVQAQRDAIFNYLMTHRGWFAIGAQRRFKGAQFNLETGQLEEGSYITMKNLLFDFFGELRSTRNVVKAMKAAYKGRGRTLKNLGFDVDENTGELERDLIARNIKRVGVEMAFMTGIVFVLAAVNAMADDEDNKDIYALQLTNYFLWRLANETSSTQLGIFNESANIIKEPVVAWQQIQDMAKIYQIFDREEMTRGGFKGHTGTYKYFFKNTVGLKGLHDLMNVRNTKNTYDYYNRGNIDFTSMGLYSAIAD
jgi:hypothetical protein